MEKDVRKLVAIMFTDLVGFSSISQEDEQLAIELLDLYRKKLRNAFSVYDGIEIKTIGDAFLVEFISALDAVNCAIEIQEKIQGYNKEQTDEGKKIRIRIGIHIGDVIHRSGDIIGDGVNIASRLEPLAHPGGICFSEDVERQIRNKINIKYVKLEKQELKNIRLPVDVYQILKFTEKIEVPSSIKNKKLAVLPFHNISTEDDNEYFSDGLTDEIIIRLSKIRDLDVVPRTTTMHFKNSKKNSIALGKELHAKYLLDGAVRKDKDKLKISTELVDVESQSQLWSEIYKGSMSDVFDIQENVSKKIVKSLELELSDKEERELTRRATMNSDAFDLNLRAREFVVRYTKKYLLAAIELFENAIAIDHEYAAAYAGMSEAYAMLYETHDRKPEWLEKAEEASLKALMYDANSSEAYSALGLVYTNKNSLTEAYTAIQKAIDLDRENIFAYWTRGRIYRLMDRDHEAADDFNKVLELNPQFQTAYIDLQLSYEKTKEKEKLAEAVGRSMKFYQSYLLKYPDDPRAHIFYAFTLKRNGETEKAKLEMQKGVDLNPDDLIVMYNAACFYSVLNDRDAAISCLKNAVKRGFGNFQYMKHDPDFDNIRNDPEFRQMIGEH